MKVSDFQDYISVWSLAALDEGSTLLTFQRDNSYLTVSFSGMHTGAVRYWPTTDVDIEGLDDEPLSVAGATLHGALALMEPSAPLEVSTNKTSLRLKAAGRSANLRKVDSGSRFILPDMVVGSRVVIDRADLGPKLTMLAGVAARTLDKPALTGINVSPTPSGSLVLRATDGLGRAVMVGQDVRESEGDFRFTAPAADISTALQECDRIVTLELDEGHGQLHINDEVTFVRLSLLQGEYPSFQHLPREFPSKLIIPTSTIVTAVKAAQLLSSQRLITLGIRDGYLMLNVEDPETGDFLIRVSATDDEPFEMHFDAEYLGQVADASGIETVIELGEPNAPVMVRGDGWYYWLNSIIKA